MIDLHTHSTYSDGTDTPAELVSQAASRGLTALALTDHDGTDGVGPLLAACAALPPDQSLRGIGGVEISADTPRGSMHILGYFIDPSHDELEATLVRIRASRGERNLRILDRLRELGCPLEWEQVAGHAGEDVVGRPHIARALEAAGYVKSARKAFDRFLAKGRPAYADRFRLSPGDSIQLIARAGGAAVLAHPVSLDCTARVLRQRVGELKELGLQGIEAYYPLHDAETEGLIVEIARELDLVATGGSDYHGGNKSGMQLGTGFGSLSVPDAVVERLEARSVAPGMV